MGTMQWIHEILLAFYISYTDIEIHHIPYSVSGYCNKTMKCLGTG